MHLTKFTDYSFRVLIHLAKDKDKVFIFDDLSKELKISEHHLNIWVYNRIFKIILLLILEFIFVAIVMYISQYFSKFRKI